jgi:hypothetical protein
MPPKSNYVKNPKKRAALDKARHARLSCGQEHSAKPFSASADDKYVHTKSSLSDAESAEEAIGDTSPGTNIYIYVIYCITRIEYSSFTSTSTKEYSCWEVYSCGNLTIVNPATRHHLRLSIVLSPSAALDRHFNSGCFNDAYNCHQCFYALMLQ